MSALSKLLLSAAPTGGLVGEVVLSYEDGAVGEWTVPDGVYSISVLTVDAGRTGDPGTGGSSTMPGNGGLGGQVGTVRYRNNMPVTPGQRIPWVVGRTNGFLYTRFGTTGSAVPSGFDLLPIPGLTRAENGGNGSSSTYESGYGGRSTTGIDLVRPLDYPIQLYGTRFPGSTTPSGKGAPGKSSDRIGGGGGGGGGGARLDGSQGGDGGLGRYGAIRIVFPGDTRQFPYDAA